MSVFGNRLIFCCLVPALLWQACYSTEFRPAQNYPVLRKRHPLPTELRFRPPEDSYDRLGVLYVHDAALDLQDDSFRSFLKKKVHELGADGAYVKHLKRKRQTMLRAQSVDYSNHAMPAGDLEMDVGTLMLILYCYRDQQDASNQK